MLTRIFTNKKEARKFQKEVKGTLIVKYEYDYFKRHIVETYLIKFN